MPGLLPNVDPDGLLEFSVVYTDRALNHMSKRFQNVMKDISSILKEVYKAKSSVLVPGSGTFGMEAVARQFATGKKTLVIRNGWFTYRWTQIFEMGGIPANYRQMQGSGVNTYKWVNGEGVGFLVKYHFEPKQGIKNLTIGREDGTGTITNLGSAGASGTKRGTSLAAARMAVLPSPSGVGVMAVTTT